MRTILLRTLKTAVALIATFLVLAMAGTVLVNMKSVQNRVMHKATEILSEKLMTHVEIDSVDISFIRQSVNLYGLQVDDRQQRRLLQLNRLSASMELLPLLHRQVVISEAEIDGMDALLLKPSADEPPNYQFLIDALKADKTDKAADTDSTTDAKSQNVKVDIDHVRLNDIHARYNDYDVRLGEAALSMGDGKVVACRLNVHYQDMDLSVGKATCLRDSHIVLSIDSLHLKRDNCKPRKNRHKPKRGWFDPGHLDVKACLQLTVDTVGNDTLSATLDRCQATDATAGFDIRDLRARIHANRSHARVDELTIQQANTVLKVSNANLKLPDKERNCRFTFTTGTISGRAVLKDIARPFAPVLERFSLPLNLSLTMDGTDNTLNFHNVNVGTDDKKLRIKAKGSINHLENGRKLAVHFDVSQMNAHSGIKEKIISQFPVKRVMMKELHRLGDISYAGSFDILWRKELFRGRLNTAGGPLHFHFGIDEQTKYVSGHLESSNFRLGQVLEMEKIGTVDCTADFKADISKPRTAKMRKNQGGKLPIGHVNAQIADCSYRKIHLRNLSADIESNGAEATGDIVQVGKRRDIYCSFSFINTDKQRKLKIKNPGIKFHKKK